MNLKLPIYLVSDNHFMMSYNKNESLRINKLDELFNKIIKDQGTLIIGGDFFDFWFDYKNVIPKYYSEVLSLLNRLNKAGIEIHYILGNHDYWDFGALNRLTGAVIHKNDFQFIIDNQKIVITHGDGILKNEYLYRFVKKIIRSNLFISLFRLIHPDIGCWIAKKISKTTYETMEKNETKQEIINQLIKKFPEHNTIFTGHYHLAGIEKKMNKKIVFMGDWINQFTVTTITNNDCFQYSWKN